MNTEYVTIAPLSEELRIEACMHNHAATQARLLRMAELAEKLEQAAAPALPAVDDAMVERALSAPMPPGHGSENVRGTFSGLFDEDVAMHAALTAVFSGPTAQEEGK